jgi:hypothetical protein
MINEKNKVIVHLKKDKGGHIERFGIIEKIDFIQRQTNNSHFSVIRKNYFRKPYLFFSPKMNLTSKKTYYK